MTLLAIIFAVLMLTLFWGGFIYMLSYSLKLRTGKEQEEEIE